MKTRILPFLTFFLSSPSCTAALPGPEADSPVLDQNGLSPRYLTDYQHIGQGISWSAHVDTELFANLAGGIRCVFWTIVGSDSERWWAVILIDRGH